MIQLVVFHPFFLFNGDVQRDNLPFKTTDHLFAFSESVEACADCSSLLRSMTSPRSFVLSSVHTFHCLKNSVFLRSLNRLSIGLPPELGSNCELPTSVSQCRCRSSVVDLCVPSLGIELPRHQRSTVSLELVGVERWESKRMFHLGAPRTSCITYDSFEAFGIL